MAKIELDYEPVPLEMVQGDVRPAAVVFLEHPEDPDADPDDPATVWEPIEVVDGEDSFLAQIRRDRDGDVLSELAVTIVDGPGGELLVRLDDSSRSVVGRCLWQLEWTVGATSAAVTAFEAGDVVTAVGGPVRARPDVAREEEAGS